MEINTTRNEKNNGLTSILYVRKLTLWDEGYYTCRSASNPNIRARLYLFVMGILIEYKHMNKIVMNAHYMFDSGMRRRTPLGEHEPSNTIRDVDPLKSYYVVSHQPSSAGKQSLIISYLNDGRFYGKYYETVLQHKTENGSWQLVVCFSYYSH